MSCWKRTEPKTEDCGLMVVETNMGTRYFIAVIDEYGSLTFPDTGDDIGWTSESVEKWCPLETVVDLVDVWHGGTND